MKDEKTKLKEEQLIEMVSSFCDEKLDEEYKELSVKLVEKLGRKHDVPFKRGRLEIWASAVIYAIGQINFLFDKSFEPYATADDICNYFNTKKSTVSNKARTIREMFNMGHFDEEFSTGALIESQPKFYIDDQSGMLIPEAMVNPMDEYFNDVYELFENGNIDEAIDMLDVFDEQHPEYERAMFYKSFILNATGVKDDSSEVFKMFLSDLKEKGLDFSDILEEEDDIDYDNPQELYEEAIFNFGVGDYEEAIHLLDIALKITPKDTKLLNLKAKSLGIMKRYKKALKVIDKAIKIDPKDDELLTTKGILLKNNDKLNKAKKTFDKAIKLNPNNDLAWASKGNILYLQNKSDEALKYYDKAIELNSEEIDYYIDKAKVYVDLEDCETAEKIFKEAEKIDENDLELLMEIGRFYIFKEDLNQALEYFDKCLKIDDEFEMALLFKAGILQELNREKEMEKCLNKLMEINPLLLLSLDELLKD